MDELAQPMLGELDVDRQALLGEPRQPECYEHLI